MWPNFLSASAPGPVVIVGDETSVAVAASFEVERPGQLIAVFQAGAVDDVRAAAERVGLRPGAVVARGDTSATVEAVALAHAASPRAVVALTGGAELVVAVRVGLRTRGGGGEDEDVLGAGGAGLD